MPSADEILAGLSETANSWRSLTVVWHLLLAALLNLGTSGWNVPLITAGLLYGIIGVFALDVVLDIALVAGALVLTVFTVFDSGRFGSVTNLVRVPHRAGEAP